MRPFYVRGSPRGLAIGRSVADERVLPAESCLSSAGARRTAGRRARWVGGGEEYSWAWGAALGGPCASEAGVCEQTAARRGG